MRKYQADRCFSGRQVMVHDGDQTRPLEPMPSQKVINHSPDGFEWGYSGSGPAQLALGILLDIYPKEIAQRFYQDFKSAFIATADHDGFTILEEDVRHFIIGLVGATIAPVSRSLQSNDIT